MDHVIATAPVRVIKDDNGQFNADHTRTRDISCDARFIAKELLNKNTHGNNCSSEEIGTAARVDDGQTIATVKISTKQFGYLWIMEADYNTFITKCNSCCGS